MRLLYDSENDVLRVFMTPEPVESIAIPGGDVTVLVSEDLDRIVGLVFEDYAGMLTRRASEVEEKDRQEIVSRSFEMLEGLIPPLLDSLAPIAKDRVATWLEHVERSDSRGENAEQ